MRLYTSCREVVCCRSVPHAAVKPGASCLFGPMSKVVLGFIFIALDKADGTFLSAR